MMGCEYFQELISCLIDGELSRDEEAQLADHLETCPECAAMYKAFKELSCIMEEDMVDAPESLCPNVMAQLRRAEIVKKNRRRSAVKAVLATAACAVLVVAAGRLTGFKSAESAVVTGGTTNTAAVYDVKIVAEEEIFAVPKDMPMEAPQATMMPAAKAPEAAVEAEVTESAAEDTVMYMTANSFALRDSTPADAGAGSTEPVEWAELSLILNGEKAPESVQLPDTPVLSLTVFHEGVYYSLSFYELDGYILYFDPLDGILKQSSASLEELTIS